MTQTTSVQLTDKNASLLQEAKQWGEKIVNAATIVFHESNTTNKIRRTVADYEEFCERLLRRNQSGPIPIVLLGRTGEGKSWLAHCFLRNRSPRHFADDPTDQQTKLLWLGPEEPPDLQPQEKYYRIPAEQMLDLGVPYLIGDAPGFSCSDEGIELAHRLAISTATVYLMVMRDASLRNGETARLVRELSGTCVVPVIRFRGNRGQAEPSLEMQQTIQKELERWRSTSANTQIAEPILVPDASLYSPDDVTPALKLTQQRLQVGLGAIVAQQARLRLNLENEFAYAARHAPDNCVNTCES